MNESSTPSQRLAAVLLGQPVHEWIAGRRSAGRSWREIVEDLSEATGGQVVVVHETLRSWAIEVAA
jgi:hypothetical protein